eukprot:TRINITY_DN46_c0_g1_i1.p1 TRINITY_DN46_c0_g1~~TRINITY_DN46_c0_g1_i1.p1  ORF type:complete len:1788 (+),score=227.99 TRINITY_DN46_c0_g1_i1:2170-7533(+)
MGFFNDWKVRLTLKDSDLAVLKAIEKDAAPDVISDFMSKSDINACDECGRTALHEAVSRGNFEAVRLLVSNNAEIKPDIDKETPLDLADKLAKGSTRDAIILQLYITNVNYVKSAMQSAIESLEATTVRAPVVDSDLFEAVYVGNIALLRNSNFDPNLTQGRSILYQAARYGQVEIVKYLVNEKGSFIDQPNESLDGSTPLHGAAYSGHPDVVKFLLEAGADESIHNKNDELPRENAKLPRTGTDPVASQECVSLLMGMTPYEVLKNGRYGLVKELPAGTLSSPLKINGQTALYVASFFGHVRVSQLIVDIDSTTVNSRNTDGATPLHACALTCNPVIMQLLLSNGALVSATNNNGESPHSCCLQADDGPQKEICLKLLTKVDHPQEGHLGGLLCTKITNLTKDNTSSAIAETVDKMVSQHVYYRTGGRSSFLQTVDSKHSTNLITNFSTTEWIQTLTSTPELGYRSAHHFTLIESCKKVIKRLHQNLCSAIGKGGDAHAKKWMVDLCTTMNSDIVVELLLAGACSGVDLGKVRGKCIINRDKLVPEQDLSLLESMRRSVAASGDDSYKLFSDIFRPIIVKYDRLLRSLPNTPTTFFLPSESHHTIDVGSHYIAAPYTTIESKPPTLNNTNDKLVMIALKEDCPNVEFLLEDEHNPCCVVGPNVHLHIAGQVSPHLLRLLQCPLDILIAQQVCRTSWFTAEEHLHILTKAIEPALEQYDTHRGIHIPQQCVQHSGVNQQTVPALETFQSWKDTEGSILCMLGSSGIGKTHWCAELVALLLKKEMNPGVKFDYPVYVDLSILPRETMLEPGMFDEYVLTHFLINREAVEFLTRSHINLIVVLDGFDGLRLTSDDFDDFHAKHGTRNMLSIHPWCIDHAKIVVTADDSYFAKVNVTASQMFGNCSFRHFNEFSENNLKSYVTQYRMNKNVDRHLPYEKHIVFNNPLFLSLARLLGSGPIKGFTESEILEEYIKCHARNQGRGTCVDVLETGMKLACEMVNNSSSHVIVSSLSPSEQQLVKCLPMVTAGDCVRFECRIVADFFVARALSAKLEECLTRMLNVPITKTEVNVVRLFVEITSAVGSTDPIDAQLLRLIEMSKANDQPVVLSNCLGLLASINRSLTGVELDDKTVVDSDLRGLVISECSYKNTTFRGCWLEGCIFQKCNLTGTVFDETCSLGAAPNPLAQHTDQVNQVLLSKERVLYSASSDSTVRSWDIKTGKQINIYRHNGSVNCIALTSQHLISAGSEGNITFWNIDSAQKDQEWPNSHSEVTCLAVSQNEKILVSGGKDKTVKIWNIDTRVSTVLVGHGGEIRNLTISTNGLRIASCSNYDSKVMVWMTTSGELKCELNHKSACRISFTQNGQELLVCGYNSTVIYDLNGVVKKAIVPAASYSISTFCDTGFKVLTLDDKNLSVWDPMTRSTLHTYAATVEDSVTDVFVTNDAKTVAYCSGCSIFVSNLVPKRPLKTQDRTAINAVCFVSDQRVVTGSSSGLISMWDTAATRPLGSVKRSSPIRAVCASHEVILAAGDEGLILTITLKMKMNSNTFRGHIGKVTSLVFSPCGTRVLSGGTDKKVVLWVVENPTTIRKATVISSHSDQVLGVEFVNESIASCSLDGTIRVTDFEGTELFCFQDDVWPTCLAFSQVSRNILYSGSTDCSIRAWDITRGQEIHRIETKQDVKSLSVSCGLIAAVFSRGGIDFWKEAFNENSDASVSEFPLTLPLQKFSSVAAIDESGKLVAVVGSDSLVRIWRVDGVEPVLLTSSGCGDIVPTFLSCEGNPLEVCSESTNEN